MKTKIVLDADVIIHFMKADSFFLLLNIFPEYEYIILDVVYDELCKYKSTKKFIDKFTSLMHKKIKIETFDPKGGAMKDYFQLLLTLDPGESACMIYCRDNRDVLGSSNLKDIKEYCSQNDITYLTTLDFLYYAYCRNKISEQECKKFIQQVVDSGSHIPVVDITQYICTVSI